MEMKIADRRYIDNSNENQSIIFSRYQPADLEEASNGFGLRVGERDRTSAQTIAMYQKSNYIFG